MRQASRRSWRIGQTQPVTVVYMVYRNTLQAEALKLVAKKFQSSLAVEGELPEEGLAAFGDDGDDLMLALAKRIVHGDKDVGADTETVDEVFARTKTLAAEAERFLVESGQVPERSVAQAEAPAQKQAESFSWEEFTRLEPPKRRGRKPGVAPVMNLFEWALGAQQTEQVLR